MENLSANTGHLQVFANVYKYDELDYHIISHDSENDTRDQ